MDDRDHVKGLSICNAVYQHKAVYADGVLGIED